MTKHTKSKTTTIGSAYGLALLATIFASQPAWAQDAPRLSINNFIGTLDVRTGNYDKITVTDADGVMVERHGANIAIDDGQSLNNINCKQTNASVKISVGKWRWNKRKGGYKDLDAYPHIIITAPENTHLAIEHAIIFGDIGNIGSADLRVRSCGNLEFANISGKFDLSLSGSGDVTIGNAASADIGIAGSGDFSAQGLDRLDISIAGSGDANIRNISGSASGSITGSGDIDLGNIGGDFIFRSTGSGDMQVGDIIGRAKISARGSGDVELARIQGGLSYAGGGSGDLDADYVSGAELFINIGGSGTAEIDDGNVTELNIKVNGSGSVRYAGSSINGQLITRGSGIISVQKPSGRVRQEKHGSGYIRYK